MGTENKPWLAVIGGVAILAAVGLTIDAVFNPFEHEPIVRVGEGIGAIVAWTAGYNWVYSNTRVEGN